jgi:hypothetical protein
MVDLGRQGQIFCSMGDGRHLRLGLELLPGWSRRALIVTQNTIDRPMRTVCSTLIPDFLGAIEISGHRVNLRQVKKKRNSNQYLLRGSWKNMAYLE